MIRRDFIYKEVVPLPQVPKAAMDYIRGLATTRPIEAIKLLRDIARIDLGSAKRVIDTMRGEKQREADRKLREAVIEWCNTGDALDD